MGKNIFLHLKALFMVFIVTSIIIRCSTTSEPAEEVKLPNIIYILTDDLGYGDIGCYGQEIISTPSIDDLASQGMIFTQHYSGSTVCAPSRCSLMTGRHTGNARIRGNRRDPLLESDTTLAQMLKKSGYRTALIGKWGLGDIGTTGHPHLKGFDHFVGYLSQTRAHNAYPEWIWNNQDTLWLGNEVETVDHGHAKGLGGFAHVKKKHTQDVFTNETLQFIEDNQDTSFFVYLSYTLPHANNEAKHFDKIGMEVPEMMGYDTLKPDWTEAQQAHAAAISYLDRDVGKIVNKLKELGIDKNTLVIFTSDNGAHKEGGNDPEVSNSSGELRGIKRDLYEGGIRVPMIASWPEKIAPGQNTDHISAFWDILPTFCDIAGQTTPEMDGLSFYPLLIGQDQPHHDYLYWEFYSYSGGKQAVRMGDWKGIYTDLSGNRDREMELYDLKTDLSETNNLAANNPDIVRTIDSVMNQARTKFPNYNFGFEKKNAE